MKKPIELTIDELAAGGDGVGRDPDGRVTFVPGAAPGDRVLAVVTEEHRGFARARLARVVAPSPDRVKPPCPLFAARSCGGCQWQHVAAGAQAAAKQAICASSLRRLIEGGMELLPIATPAPPYGWRRRARLRWWRPRGGRALIGLYAPKSHRVTDVPACPQLEEALEGALGAVRGRLAGAVAGEGVIELLAGHRGQIDVRIAGRCDPRAARALVGVAGIVGVEVAAGADARRFGASTLELEPGLPGRAGSFAQASLAGNRALVAAVDEAATPRAGAAILELFAGGGNFTRVLAEGAARVLATDAARAPWRMPGGAVVEVRIGAAEEVAAALAEAGERFDLAVLDPPRTGARALVPALVRLAPARIVYVSCDPATLARDLEALVAGGYRALRAQPLDLMPQTAHVELVAVLERQ